ncbi:hypothetical protein MRX96_058451 [Rhipicephalus microplus]
MYKAIVAKTPTFMECTNANKTKKKNVTEKQLTGSGPDNANKKKSCDRTVNRAPSSQETPNVTLPDGILDDQRSGHRTVARPGQSANPRALPRGEPVNARRSLRCANELWPSTAGPPRRPARPAWPPPPRGPSPARGSSPGRHRKPLPKRYPADVLSGLPPHPPGAQATPIGAQLPPGSAPARPPDPSDHSSTTETRRFTVGGRAISSTTSRTTYRRHDTSRAAIGGHTVRSTPSAHHMHLGRLHKWHHRWRALLLLRHRQDHMQQQRPRKSRQRRQQPSLQLNQCCHRRYLDMTQLQAPSCRRQPIQSLNQSCQQWHRSLTQLQEGLRSLQARHQRFHCRLRLQHLLLTLLTKVRTYLLCRLQPL